MEQRTSVAQDELIAFLLDPESYPHHPKRVRLVQTHASYVFLGFPYVYKVKKKVNFGFLDFSSLENRRYYSEREVILNRRLCPEVYLGVIPISILAGKLTFGEGEKVVEYAVKMRNSGISISCFDFCSMIKSQRRTWIASFRSSKIF